MRPPSPGDCPAFVKAAPREEGLHKLVASQATDNAQDSSGQHTVPGGGELPSVPANKETSTNIQHVASEITAVKENVTAIDSTNNKNSDDQNKETSKNSDPSTKEPSTNKISNSTNITKEVKEYKGEHCEKTSNC